MAAQFSQLIRMTVRRGDESGTVLDGFSNRFGQMCADPSLYSGEGVIQEKYGGLRQERCGQRQCRAFTSSQPVYGSVPGQTGTRRQFADARRWRDSPCARDSPKVLLHA
jgi:hypothetical protein